MLKRLVIILSNNKEKFISYALSVILILAAVYLNSWILAAFSIVIITIQQYLQLTSKNKRDYFISFSKSSDKKDWIGEGEFAYRKSFDGFEVQKAEAGMLFNKCFDWVDYKIEFNFKILKECIGVIVRAENFSNYVMLQIRDFGIRPHFKINGHWIAIEAEDANTKFEKKLSFDKFYKTIISLEKDSIVIKILDDQEIIFDREWRIPNGQTYILRNADSEVPSISLPVNLQKGTFGFRNTQNESALIKNLVATSN